MTSRNGQNDVEQLADAFIRLFTLLILIVLTSAVLTAAFSHPRLGFCVTITADGVEHLYCMK